MYVRKVFMRSITKWGSVYQAMNRQFLQPIKVQIHSAPQNDRLDFSFMKDIHETAKKMARKGRK